MREINVTWTKAGPLNFEATAPTGQIVQMDSSVDSGGSNLGFSPKTLLMVALGGCTGMDVLSMLRKMRQDVTAYHLELKGWEEAEYPKKFDKIVVEHVIEGHNL